MAETLYAMIDIANLKAVLPWLGTIATVLIAYFLGLHAYRKQREYELVRSRYLDEGLDTYAADVEHALSVMRTNWQHALTILKFYREVDVQMRQGMLDESYIDLDMSQLRVHPNYRIGVLIGDRTFWDLQQLLFACVGQAKIFFKDDLGGAVRYALTNPLKSNEKKTMVDTYFVECNKLFDEALRYHILLAKVEEIATEFEQSRFTLKSVRKFKEREQVKAIVKELKDVFHDELEEYRTISTHASSNDNSGGKEE